MKPKKQELPVIYNIQDKLFRLRNMYVLLDADVATLYGVETKHVNQAVRNNPEKFPEGYTFNLEKQEFADLKSKFLTSSETSSGHGGRRKIPTAFTEKGLYMLATILKSPVATQATLAIVETFSKVRELKQELVNMQTALDAGTASPQEQKQMISRFGETLSDIVMPDLKTYETEASMELNFFIGKLKYTVKRRKELNKPDTTE